MAFSVFSVFEGSKHFILIEFQLVLDKTHLNGMDEGWRISAKWLAMIIDSGLASVLNKDIGQYDPGNIGSLPFL